MTTSPFFLFLQENKQKLEEGWALKAKPLPCVGLTQDAYIQLE